MTALSTIRRIGALLSVTAATLVATACGGNSPEAAQWVASSPGSPAPRTSAPIKQITSACKLLPADVAVKVLGSSKGTRLTAKEQQAESPKHVCSYVNGGREAFALVTSELPDRADTVTESLDAIADKAGAKVTRLNDLGEGALTYVSDGGRILAIAVTYQDTLRLVVFSGPSVIPLAKYRELAEHVVPQL